MRILAIDHGTKRMGIAISDELKMIAHPIEFIPAEPVHNLADAMKSDRERFAKYFHGMLEQGIYLAPSQFEAGFLSTAHSPEDIERTALAARKVLKGL